MWFENSCIWKPRVWKNKEDSASQGRTFNINHPKQAIQGTKYWKYENICTKAKHPDAEIFFIRTILQEHWDSNLVWKFSENCEKRKFERGKPSKWKLRLRVACLWGKSQVRIWENTKLRTSKPRPIFTGSYKKKSLGWQHRTVCPSVLVLWNENK